MPVTYEDSREVNARLYDLMFSGRTKEAADILSDFTRTTYRERSVIDELIEPISMTIDQNVRRISDDSPYYVVDVEPDSPAAISIGWGAFGTAVHVRTKRYPIGFYRIWGPRVIADEARLKTYTMDIRQVMADNIIKDMLMEHSTQWFAGINEACGTLDAASLWTGSVQHKTYTGHMSRDALGEIRKIMPRTPYRLQAEKAAASIMTKYDLEKFYFNEMGGDLSEEFMLRGMATAEFATLKWTFTINDDLIPEDEVYLFARQDYIGKNIRWNEPQMWIHRDGPMIQWEQWMEVGAGIGHVAGITRHKFA